MNNQHNHAHAPLVRPVNNVWQQTLVNQVADFDQQEYTIIGHNIRVYRLTDACMQSLCALWHAGQTSEMYRYTCAGPDAVNMHTLRKECEQAIEELEQEYWAHDKDTPQQDIRQLHAMIQYCRQHYGNGVHT